jgi:hypothetical protein
MPPLPRIIALSPDEFENQKNDFKFASAVCKNYLEDKYNTIIHIKLDQKNIYKEYDIKNNKIVGYLIRTDYSANWKSPYGETFISCEISITPEGKWKIGR